jgi:hypothetical protein
VAIDFGGITVRVTSGSMEWTGRLAARLAGYLTGDAPGFTVDIVSKVALAAALGGREPRAAAAFICLRASSYAATIDLAGRGAWITGRPTPGTVVNLMRYLLPLLVPGSAVFHAGVLAEGGRGFLMAGRSGCGKSSLARMLRGRALGDEVGVVRAGPDGFTVHGSPHRVGRRGSAALAGIYLLARGRDGDERIRLAPAAALGRLSALAFWPAGHECEMRATLETLARLAETVPVWELRFRLRPDVWELIAAPPEVA